MFTTSMILLALAGSLGSASNERVHINFDGALHEIELSPINLRASTFRVLVPGANGELKEFPAPTSTPLRGKIVGTDEYIVTSRAQGDGQLQFIRIREVHGPRAWRVEGDDPRRRAILVIEPDPSAGCGADLLDQIQPPPAPPAGGTAGSGCAVRCQVGFDADWEFYADMGFSENAAVEAIEDSLNEVDALYARQTLSEFELTAVIVRTDQSADPYYGLDGAGNLLDMLRVVWTNQKSGIPHDIGHLISGTSASDGILGLAWVTAVCTNYCYGMSRTTSPGVIAHEIGHNFSLPHCLDPSCTTMCGACMDFGPISALQARQYIANRWCVESIPETTVQVAPYCYDDTAEMINAVSIDIDAIANDVDGNCDELTLTWVTPSTPLGGVAEIVDNQIRYTPPPNAIGSDDLEYWVNDGTGREDSATVTVSIYTTEVDLDHDRCELGAPNSLQEALAGLHPQFGGTVRVGPGVWNGTASWSGSGDLEIRSKNGPEETILRGATIDSLLIIDNPDAEVVIHGFNFAGDMSILDGGALRIASDVAYIQECRFIECSSHENGGAINFDGRSLFIDLCRFDDCHALYGGSIYAQAVGSVNIESSDISSSIAFKEAGAIQVITPTLRFSDSTLAFSVAPTGNAIHATDDVRIANSIICGSDATDIVGNIFDDGGNDLGGNCACQEVTWRVFNDCDDNGIDDRCQIIDGSATDDNDDGTLDSCMSTTSTQPILWSLDCGGNGHWYEVRLTPMNLSDARGDAVSRGGILVSINSAAENDFIYSMLEYMPTAWDKEYGPWLGLWSGNSKWWWLDGTAFNYNAWASGEPTSGDDGAVFFISSEWYGMPSNFIATGYIVEFTGEDCDEDGAPDDWEIAVGNELDINDNGIPDVCEELEDPADLNGDGYIDGGDLGLLLAGWGSNGSSDINGDGTTDGGDLGILLAAWSPRFP